MLKKVERVEKPWGYELIFAHTDDYVGKILHVNAGEALSLQYHEVKDETLYLSAGSMELIVQEGEEMVSRTLTDGDSYHSPPFTKPRRIGGPEGCDILEVSTPHLKDVVRIEDRYGRVGS